MEHKLWDCKTEVFFPAGSSISAGSRWKVKIAPGTASSIENYYSPFIVCMNVCYFEVTSDQRCCTVMGAVWLVVGKNIKVTCNKSTLGKGVFIYFTFLEMDIVELIFADETLYL